LIVFKYTEGWITMKRQLSDAALTSKVIKTRLKALFPDVKFSVRCDNFSMGDSVDIYWTDGPMQADVEVITKQYQHGDFDGMQDIYEYKDIDPALECPGAKYVFCSRECSPALKERINEKIKEIYGDINENDNYYYRRSLEVEKEYFPYAAVTVSDTTSDAKTDKAASIISGLEYTVTKDVHTKTNNEIFVVKVITRVDDFKSLNLEMHGYGGYYSKFKSGFIFKEDPTEKLRSDTPKTEAETCVVSEIIVETAVADEMQSNVLSLLDKFNTVEVTAADRFSPDDMAFCEEEEKIYKEAHKIHTDILVSAYAFFEKYEKNSQTRKCYVSEYSGGKDCAGINNYRNNVMDTNQNFISNICNYFAKKYNVTIEKPKWEAINNEYFGNNRLEVSLDIMPLNFVLDSIFQQMGGRTFTEKALDEIKSSVKKCVYTEYNNKWKMAIKGVKLHIDGFYSSGFCNIYKRYEISIKEKNNAFFKALTHFEYNSAYIDSKYDKYTGNYTIREETGIYDKHAVISSVISTIKVYKNGKVEFEFIDSAKARLFAKNYCGYNGQPAA